MKGGGKIDMKNQVLWNVAPYLPAFRRNPTFILGSQQFTSDGGSKLYRNAA
jgi:hypothetical protein